MTAVHESIVFSLILKGLCYGDFHVFVKNVPKFKLNTLSRTRNIPTTSREGNRMIFSRNKGET